MMHDQKNIRLSALPRQQWLRESTSGLRYTHIACLVIFCVLTDTKISCVKGVAYPKPARIRRKFFRT